MAEDTLDFLEFIEEVDFYNGELHGRTRITRSRPNWFQIFDEIDFFKRYRMCKRTALWILDQIAEDLEYTSDRNQSVPPVNQLLLTLRFYATGSHHIAIGDMNGVDVSTVSRVIKRVTNAIVKLRNQHIKMPGSSNEIQEKKSAFYAIASFPYVIGTIDCTHVKIQSPGT
ncbi:putative nuclease HARBI1 [Operophtera brumata]|uniref:Putative nuclease HARBI1 n=1 Tax=Operophtera brumata TaxID=104452 RepID=A0A0L7KSD9_OPEBR|nr:putative nuclease HARBI1 [Operophtera brumata]